MTVIILPTQLAAASEATLDNALESLPPWIDFQKHTSWSMVLLMMSITN